MRSKIGRITLKIIEVLGCVACFITKVITDLESRRIFLRSQKYSREWSLLHNVTWSSAGNTFANITYGGFSLITTLMLISRCIDPHSAPSVIEKIFLVVGMLGFFAMGGLVLAAFDQVPWELHDNSIILGCLSFFVALVMLYDLADPIARQVTDTTQTDGVYTVPQQIPQPQPLQPTQPQQQQNHTETTKPNSSNAVVQTIETNQTTEETVKPAEPAVEKVITQMHNTQSTGDMPADDIAKNGNYHRGDTIDFVQLQHAPQPEQPVFERVLLPEKKRPTFSKVADAHKTSVVQNVHEYGLPDTRRHDHVDSTMHYNQMPKYAVVQRQQASSHLDHPSSYTPYSTSMYKLSGNYEHNDYERPPTKLTTSQFDRLPPKHTIKATRSDELSRYHGAAPEHYQTQPMMVIRNYSQPISRTTAHNLSERRHHQSNDNMYRNNGTRNHGAHLTQMNSRKNCCSPDDEVDFRKMNSAIRPGFVASVAKMWDRRAVENAAEFNTIV